MGRNATRMAARGRFSPKSLTPEYVRSLLEYDPESGLLRWKIDRGGGIKAGDIAGSKSDSCVFVSIHDKPMRIHRVIWFIVTGKWPKECIDHIDRNPFNNKWNNLREATKAENNRNSKFKPNNTTGHTGIRIRKNYGAYEARIMANGQEIHLGSFKTLEKALETRRKAEIKYHGEFARSR
jgi:hypothetical protein